MASARTFFAGLQSLKKEQNNLSTLRGYVEEVVSSPGPYGLMHRVKIDNVRYGTGKVLAPVKVGDYVEFEGSQTPDGKYWNANASSFKQLDKPSPTASAPAGATFQTVLGPATMQPKAPYVDRNESIVYQSSRKDAIETVKLLVQAGALDVSKQKSLADKQEVLELYIDKLTVRYVEDVGRCSPPEHPVEKIKTKVAKPAVDSEFVDDDLPDLG